MNDPKKAALEELLKNHTNSKEFTNEDVVKKTASLFLFLSDGFIRRASNETFYLLPYKDISTFVFSNDCVWKSEAFSSFTSTVFDEMQKLEEYSKSPYSAYLSECYNKLTQHISLAYIQKDHIAEVASNANIAAKKAQIAAEKSKEMQKDMMVNYITILGIFASIIFTLFGGVNLISATVKLLEANSRWPYLTFIISLLMICFLTLLNMMATWITSINNLKNELKKKRKEEAGEKNQWYNPLTWDFYTKAVSCFLIVLLVSLCGMYLVNKENLFSITTETTTKNIPKNEEQTNKLITKLKPENENKEITVVEKFTLSNHSNEKSPDKE